MLNQMTVVIYHRPDLLSCELIYLRDVDALRDKDCRVTSHKTPSLIINYKAYQDLDYYSQIY